VPNIHIENQFKNNRKTKHKTEKISQT